MKEQGMQHLLGPCQKLKEAMQLPFLELEGEKLIIQLSG